MKIKKKTTYTYHLFVYENNVEDKTQLFYIRKHKSEQDDVPAKTSPRLDYEGLYSKLCKL